ncbi:hypothetical protein LTR16_011146, partial [Cryomyces antarcticus]
MHINEEGEVVDKDGEVVGNMELAEGAAEKLAEIKPYLNPMIFDGKKLNKKGLVLDEEGDEIGHLVEGDLADCAGKMINDKGEVLNKKGKPIGKVEITPGDAADTALAELKARLAAADDEEEEEEAPEEPQPEAPATDLPSLDILEGLKVNKKGQVLNEDGEPIGELTEGELS